MSQPSLLVPGLMFQGETLDINVLNYYLQCPATELRASGPTMPYNFYAVYCKDGRNIIKMSQICRPTWLLWKSNMKVKRKINFYSVLNVRQDTGIDKSCKKIDLYSIMDIFKCDRLIIIEISAIQMSLCTSQIL